MNPLIATILGTGAAEIFATESPTGTVQSTVVKGLSVVSAPGSGYFFHGLRARGWPPISAVMNGSILHNPGTIFTSNNDISCMQIILLPQVSTPTGGVCFGVGANRPNGFMAHRNGAAQWMLLFQNIRWVSTGIAIGGGLWDPKVVIWSRESSNWFVNINGVKTGMVASDTPTNLSSSEHYALSSENSEVVYGGITAWWNKVLTTGEISAINAKAIRCLRTPSSLAA